MSETVEKERLPLSVELSLNSLLHQLRLNLAKVPSNTTDSQDVICSNNNSNEVEKPPQIITSSRKDTEEDKKQRQIHNKKMRDYRARKKKEERLTKERLKMVTYENTKLKIENSKLREALQAVLSKDCSSISSSF